MKKQDFLVVMERALEEVRKVYGEGHKEYAHTDDNVFANFERVSEEIGVDRNRVLWTYFIKHKDGIAAYIKGHKSQREDVRGRIKDAIVYLLMLRGMVDEDEDLMNKTREANGK